MLNAIPQVAQKWITIGTRFGVPIATTMYINMDYAGGHGTGNAISTYTTRCLEEACQRMTKSIIIFFISIAYILTRTYSRTSSGVLPDYFGLLVLRSHLSLRMASLFYRNLNLSLQNPSDFFQSPKPSRSGFFSSSFL